MSHTAEPARGHWRRTKPNCGEPTAKGARRACAFKRTTGEAPGHERRHRHGGGRCLVLYGSGPAGAAAPTRPIGSASTAPWSAPARRGGVGPRVRRRPVRRLAIRHYPAKRGLRVFAVDARCFGRSVCPQGDAAGRVVDDHGAAVVELRQRGVTRVTLGGASIWRLGGADRRQATKASSRRGSRAIGPGEPDRPALSSAQRRGAVQQLTVRGDVRGRQITTRTPPLTRRV